MSKTLYTPYIFQLSIKHEYLRRSKMRSILKNKFWNLAISRIGLYFDINFGQYRINDFIKWFISTFFVQNLGKSCKPKFTTKTTKLTSFNQFLPTFTTFLPFFDHFWPQFTTVYQIKTFENHKKRFLCIQVRVKYHDPQESNHDSANPWNIQLPAYDDNSTNMHYNDVAEP